MYFRNMQGRRRTSRTTGGCDRSCFSGPGYRLEGGVARTNWSRRARADGPASSIITTWEKPTVVGDDTRGRSGVSAVALVGDDAVGAAVRVVEACPTTGSTASLPSALVALEYTAEKTARNKRFVNVKVSVRAVDNSRKARTYVCTWRLEIRSRSSLMLMRIFHGTISKLCSLVFVRFQAELLFDTAVGKRK